MSVMEMNIIEISDVCKLLEGDWDFGLYYKDGIVYRVMNGGIFEAWKPFRKNGKVISVYGAEWVKDIHSIPVPDLNEENLILSRKKTYGIDEFRPEGYFSEICKKIEGKGFEIPVQPLDKEEEKEYIEYLKMGADPLKEIYHTEKKEVLERKLSEIV